MASPHSIQWSAILQKRTGGRGLLRFFNIITINDHESGMKFDFVSVFFLSGQMDNSDRDERESQCRRRDVI